MSPDVIAQRLSGVPGWKTEGQSLIRSYKFDDFAAALAFVNQVGAIAEREEHHPDIELGWGRVKLAWTTHDAGGLTDKDFALAKLVDASR